MQYFFIHLCIFRDFSTYNPVAVSMVTVLTGIAHLGGTVDQKIRYVHGTWLVRRASNF